MPREITVSLTSYIRQSNLSRKRMKWRYFRQQTKGKTKPGRYHHHQDSIKEAPQGSTQGRWKMEDGPSRETCEVRISCDEGRGSVAANCEQVLLPHTSLLLPQAAPLSPSPLSLLFSVLPSLPHSFHWYADVVVSPIFKNILPQVSNSCTSFSASLRRGP